MQLTEIRKGMCVTVEKGRKFAQAMVLGIRTVQGPNGKPQRRIALRRLRGRRSFDLVLPRQIRPKERYYQLLGRVEAEAAARKQLDQKRDQIARLFNRHRIQLDQLCLSENYRAVDLSIPVTQIDRLLEILQGNMHENHSQKDEQSSGTSEPSGQPVISETSKQWLCCTEP